MESSSYNSCILFAPLHTKASKEKVFPAKLHKVIVEILGSMKETQLSMFALNKRNFQEVNNFKINDAIN